MRTREFVEAAANNGFADCEVSSTNAFSQMNETFEKAESAEYLVRVTKIPDTDFTVSGNFYKYFGKYW